MIKIVYKDVPTGALENVTITSNNQQPFISTTDLKDETITATKYASLEDDFFLLDDTFILMPETITKMEYMSTEMSDENGLFKNPVVLTRTYPDKYTATGLTIKFDTLTGDYCTEFCVKWYRDEELITETNFFPNTTEYVAVHTAEAYNKMVLEFKKTSKPYRYLKVHFLVDGMTRIFDKEELMNLELIEEISDSAETLPINTLNFDIIAKQPLAYIFQNTQPMKLYHGEEFLGTFFVNEAQQKSSKEFNVDTHDYIGIANTDTYNGGIYSDITAEMLIADILRTLPYTIADNLKGKLVSGYLPRGTKRDALMHVAFAIGGLIDTSRENQIIIKEYPKVISSTIGKDRVFRGITTNIRSITSKIKLATHEYVPLTTTNDIQTLYEDTLNGQIVIEFSEPIHSLEITGGTIVQGHTNYAIISGSGSTVKLTGKGYSDRIKIIEATNPMNTASTIESIKQIETATLITKNNGIEVLNRLQEIYFSNKTVKATIILENEMVGDLINIETDYGMKQARILTMTIDLNGKKKYAELELLEV